MAAEGGYFLLCSLRPTAARAHRVRLAARPDATELGDMNMAGEEIQVQGGVPTRRLPYPPAQLRPPREAGAFSAHPSFLSRALTHMILPHPHPTSQHAPSRFPSPWADPTHRQLPRQCACPAWEPLLLSSVCAFPPTFVLPCACRHSCHPRALAHPLMPCCLPIRQVRMTRSAFAMLT